MASLIIKGLDKTYSIESSEWHGEAIVPLNPDGTKVSTLLQSHLTDIFHPIVPLTLASDGPAMTGTITTAALENIQSLISRGDVMGAFLAARSALFPDRVELPEWKGVAADMRHCGGGLVPLAIHGNGYKEIENAAFWNAKERALKDIPHIVTTAGTLDGCKRFYICIELPDAAYKAAGENFKEYLCIVTSHDGTMAAQAFISRTRIVCNNTFTAAEAGTKCRLAIRHTKFADAEFVGLEKFILDAMEGRAKFQEAYQVLKETKLDKADAMAAVTGFFYSRTIGKRNATGRKNDTTGAAGNDRLSTRVRNQIDEIFQAFQTGKGNDGENVADLLNGFTDHYTNGSGTGLTKGGEELTALQRHGAAQWGSPMEVKTEVSRLLLQPDGTFLKEMIQVGKDKGMDAYLEGTGQSKPVFLSGLDRTRAKGPVAAPVASFAEKAATAAAPSTVPAMAPAAPVADAGKSVFDSLLDMPFTPKGAK
jgi:hypothetical protein